MLATLLFLIGLGLLFLAAWIPWWGVASLNRAPTLRRPGSRPRVL